MRYELLRSPLPPWETTLHGRIWTLEGNATEAVRAHSSTCDQEGGCEMHRTCREPYTKKLL